jgi:hypothetical protein
VASSFFSGLNATSRPDTLRMILHPTVCKEKLVPNMHAQSNFSAKWMGFEILKPDGGGAPVHALA